MKDHPRRFLQAVEPGMASQRAADHHCAEKPNAVGVTEVTYYRCETSMAG
jgi:hypothetical protein